MPSQNITTTPVNETQKQLIAIKEQELKQAQDRVAEIQQELVAMKRKLYF